LLRTKSDDVVERVKALLEERRQLERTLADTRRQLALGVGPGNGATKADGSVEAAVNGVKMFIRTVEGLNPRDLRSLVDEGKKQVGSGVVVIAGVTAEGKANLAVGVTADLTPANNAVELVRIGAEALGGKGGGGRPDFAQAGGPDGSKAKAAIEAIKASIRAG
jgi:alanyl-tRNA synthetase